MVQLYWMGKNTIFGVWFGLQGFVREEDTELSEERDPKDGVQE